MTDDVQTHALGYALAHALDDPDRLILRAAQQIMLREAARAAVLAVDDNTRIRVALGLGQVARAGQHAAAGIEEFLSAGERLAAVPE